MKFKPFKSGHSYQRKQLAKLEKLKQEQLMIREMSIWEIIKYSINKNKNEK